MEEVRRAMARKRENDTGQLNDTVFPVGTLVTANDRGKRRFIPPPAPPSDPIPDDVIIDILSRLPVKSLLRFKCVSKSWNSIISDPLFVKHHFQKSTVDPTFSHHMLVPQSCFLRDGVVSCSVQSLFNNLSTVPENLVYPLNPEYDVVGYCHGLFCLVCDGEGRSEKKVRLWNPSTNSMSQKSPSILTHYSPFDRHRTVFGFGYDELSDTYKVVSVLRNGNENPSVNVISLGTSAWREVQGFPEVTVQWGKSGEFVRGTVNWLTKPIPSTIIVSFDLRSETCRTILLPYDIDRSCFVATEIGVLRDCLCVSQNYECNYFVVWQMVEYGVEESWTRLLSISYLDLGMQHYAFLQPLCMSENGDVLLITNLEECKVVLYNPRENRLEFRDIRGKKSWFRSKVFVQSLVAPSC